MMPVDAHQQLCPSGKHYAWLAKPCSHRRAVARIMLATRAEETRSMADQAPLAQPPIFNSNAYSPAEIKEAIEKVGVKKTRLPLQASFMLAMVAGGSVGLGALYYTIVASDAELSFATIRVVGGLAVSLGRALVLIGGAE